MDRAREDDFAAYVGLHWQPLVRTLVLLDCPPDRAEQVARTALSRVHRSWARIRRSDDVDVQVFRRLLRTWPDTRRRHTRRTALVLHSVGGMSGAQVVAVLGNGAVAVGDALHEDDPLGLLGLAPDNVEVGPPPLDAIVEGSGHRAVRGRVLVAAATVVALAGGGAVVRLQDPAAPSAAGSPTPSAAGSPSQSAAGSPAPSAAASKPQRVTTAPVPYLAEGRLHVGALTLPALGVTDLIDPGVGAVYRSQAADIVLVDKAGGTAEIGHNAATGMVADPERGWVFWLTYTQQLVVYDAREGHAVAQRTTLDPLDSFRNSRALALDEGIAYYDTPRGVRAWHVGPDRVTRTVSKNPAFLARDGDLVVAPTRDFLGIVMTRAGKPLWRRGALLAPRVVMSADGARVLVLSASASPLLFEASSGDEAPTGLPSGARVTSIAFTRDGAAVYVVEHNGRTSALVECRGTPPRCTTVTTVSGGLAVAR